MFRWEINSMSLLIYISNPLGLLFDFKVCGVLKIAFWASEWELLFVCFQMPVLDVKLKTNKRIVLWSGENVIIPSTTAACPCGWNRTIAALSASRTGWSRESGSESSRRRSSSSQLFGALVDLVIRCPTEARTLQGSKSSNRRWICGLLGLIKGMVWPFSVLFSEILYN